MYWLAYKYRSVLLTTFVHANYNYLFITKHSTETPNLPDQLFVSVNTKLEQASDINNLVGIVGFVGPVLIFIAVHYLVEKIPNNKHQSPNLSN
jgi:hypothetical protein